MTHGDPSGRTRFDGPVGNGDPSGPVAVQARGWGWRHSTRKAWAVRGLDLDVEPGQRILLLGASGAGKSTLLAGLAGLLDAGESSGGRDTGSGDEEGALLLDGVAARAARLLAVRAGGARTGLLLQDPQAQTVLARCGDDVAFGLENHAVPRAAIWERVGAALRGVGFPYGLEHPTSRLSGGERQRLAFAGVLALRPGLLLLDEPTAMLDPHGAQVLREQVSAALDSTGATCILVEHRVAEWLPMVDRVVVLSPGAGAVADGTPDDVLRGHGAELARGGVWVPKSFAVRANGDRGEAGRSSSALTAKLSGEGGGGGELLLSARGLAAQLPGQREPAVQGIDLDLRAGEVTCVVGPNGVGKSTLAFTVAGLVEPAGGSLTAQPALAKGAGPQPWVWRPRELVSRIGTVFQDPRHQFVAGSVAEELAIGPRRVGVGEPELARRTASLLERLRLAHLARANPFTLSGGEQRRLSVATALATRPSLLVLDEPTFGQDSRTWAELVDLLAELTDDGAAVVACTHDDALVDVFTTSGSGRSNGRVLQLTKAATP